MSFATETGRTGLMAAVLKVVPAVSPPAYAASTCPTSALPGIGRSLRVVRRRVSMNGANWSGQVSGNGVW